MTDYPDLGDYAGPGLDLSIFSKARLSRKRQEEILAAGIEGAAGKKTAYEIMHGFIQGAQAAASRMGLIKGG